MDILEKNLLDLQHSLFSTKGAILFTIGIGGAISIISLLNNFAEDPFPLLLGLIWFIIFGAISIIQFYKCNKIQNRVRKELSKKTQNSGNYKKQSGPQL